MLRLVGLVVVCGVGFLWIGGVSGGVERAVIEVGIEGVGPKVDQQEREGEVWKSLSREARKVLTQRAKHVYRFGDDVIVDVFDMMFWQDEMKKNIVVNKRTKTTTELGIRQTRVVSEKLEYRDDEKMRAYFSIPTHPCLVWYKGRLMNDKQRWGDPEYKEIRIEFLVEGEQLLKVQEVVFERGRLMFPGIVIVDPLAHREKKELYSRVGSGSSSGLVKLKYGMWAHFERDATVSLSRKRDDALSSQGSFYLAADKDLRDGMPSSVMKSYALVPVGIRGGSSALGAQRSGGRDDQIEYEIRSLKEFRMSAKELAVAFVDGEIEVPYRVGKRVGGEWRYEEKLLKRPTP